MSLEEALVLFHLLLMTYWLGGDLGVFYASRFVLRPDLAPATRAVAARVMLALDLAPRVCLVLFLPSGVSLIAAHPLGADFRGWPTAAVWLLAAAWLAMVVAESRLRGVLHRAVARLDLLVRAGVCAGTVTAGLYAVVVDTPFGASSNPRWLGAKVAAYGVAIACGIAIRYALRPFAPAFAALVSTGSTPQVERDLARSIRRSIPYVLTIWACVLLAAALGVAQPGGTWAG